MCWSATRGDRLDRPTSSRGCVISRFYYSYVSFIYGEGMSRSKVFFFGRLVRSCSDGLVFFSSTSPPISTHSLGFSFLLRWSRVSCVVCTFSSLRWVGRCFFFHLAVGTFFSFLPFGLTSPVYWLRRPCSLWIHFFKNGVVNVERSTFFGERKNWYFPSARIYSPLSL